MTIDQLENYRANCVELKSIEESLGDSVVVIATQSASNFPYSLHTVTDSGLPKGDPNIEYLQERRQQLIAATSEVRAFLREMPESKIKKMIECKYIIGKREPSWLVVAFSFGYHDEGTPRKKIIQFLQKNL